MNEDDLEYAKRLWASIGETAAVITQRLVKSCRENDGVTAALIAAQLKSQPESSLLAMVLGQLTTRLVSAETRAAAAHGPLVTPQDMGLGPEALEPEPWQQAVADQLDAAAKDNDYRLYARTAVDNQLKSLEWDREAGNDHDWDAMFRGMLLVDQQTMVVLATEMLYRLSGGAP